MLRTFSRRLARVEDAIPLPLTLERFVTRVEQRMKRTGESVDSAIENLLKDLSKAELELIVEDGEGAGFGCGKAARDEVNGNVLDESQRDEH